jgi:tetratricopeptide (TPR) repeat protein
MKTFLFLLAVSCLTPGLRAQQRESLLPPTPPQQPPPQANPAPPRNTARTIPLQETIPDWQARWELARALSYLQRYDESLGEYRKVLAERPNDAAVRQDYGQVLLWAGRPAEAQAELDRVPADQRTPAASLALADALVAGRRYDEAEAIYRRVLAANPADQLTRLKLAEILSWTKRYDDSLALYREILAALPADGQVRRRYALVLMWSGRSAEAAAELRRTLPE